MTSGLIIGLLVLIVSIGLLACKLKSDKTANQQDKTAKKTKLEDNPYLGLRDQAINLTPEQLQLSDLSEQEIFGVIMDWNMGNAIVTVTSLKTGDASIYMSTGQAFIGGIGHETVTKAAKGFVALCENYLKYATKTDKTNPISGKKIDFYFLTKSGKFYLEEDFANIESNRSKLIGLFEAANQVITEYRLITEKK